MIYLIILINLGILDLINLVLISSCFIIVIFYELIEVIGIFYAISYFVIFVCLNNKKVKIGGKVSLCLRIGLKVFGSFI